MEGRSGWQGIILSRTWLWGIRSGAWRGQTRCSIAPGMQKAAGVSSCATVVAAAETATTERPALTNRHKHPNIITQARMPSMRHDIVHIDRVVVGSRSAADAWHLLRASAGADSSGSGGSDIMSLATILHAVLLGTLWSSVRFWGKAGALFFGRRLRRLQRDVRGASAWFTDASLVLSVGPRITHPRRVRSAYGKQSSSARRISSGAISSELAPMSSCTRRPQTSGTYTSCRCFRVATSNGAAALALDKSTLGEVQAVRRTP
jgi:hypothetical protein